MSRARDLANLGDINASDLTTGTLGNTVQDNITRLGTVTTGTMNNTIGDSATFNSKYAVCTKIFSFWHSTVYAGIIGSSATEVVSIGVGNATFANSIYFISFSVAYNIEDASLTDRGDLAMGAWLQQDSDTSKKYRFGVYRTWSGRHTGMETAFGNYWLADTDGGKVGTSSAYLWNQFNYSGTDIGGNRSTNATQYNVASNFDAGESLTLKVQLGCQNAGINYNCANTTGIASAASKSFYCIKEFTQVN